ncbi:hypothetical protein DM02DRAFT_611381 [Periconia macrospinosa]|uniref:Uncharacterized protein n=1 Tax=Periconia macrospinosa TaxID=97972 RepID=A0A2V1E316_9PLEO|nr:hypothetical protein DM02DRAFT_611381 [Periconia macrospinosa]
MSRSQPLFKNEDVETIDLTGSPEPPAPSQTRRPQQPQAPISNFFNRQGPSSGARNVLAGKIQKHAPNAPISPDHLRRIITTSPPHAVNAVLLELCKLSPALSGAVVRGLSPHSKYAQDITRRYEKRPLEPVIKRDPGSQSSSSVHRRHPQEEYRYHDAGKSLRESLQRNIDRVDRDHASSSWSTASNSRKATPYRPSNLKRDYDDFSAPSNSEVDSEEEYFNALTGQSRKPSHPFPGLDRHNPFTGSNSASRAESLEARRKEVLELRRAEAAAPRRQSSFDRLKPDVSRFDSYGSSHSASKANGKDAAVARGGGGGGGGESSGQSSHVSVKPEPYDAPLRQSSDFVRETLKTCKKCFKQITGNDFSTCICHTGLILHGPKGLVYECCGGNEEAPGCSREFHDVS